MNNYKLWIQYDGTRYEGWQRQGNTENTIQGKIEAVLSRMLEQPVEIHGSGRTDAGAHAKGQIANFWCEKNLKPQKVKDYLNQYLPQDIAVLGVQEADERFHSRLNAARKTYVYRIWNNTVPNVFENRFMWQMAENVDIQLMQLAAVYLMGEHDYRSFCANKRMKKSTVRRVERIQIEKLGDEIRFTFTGNGFLYNMVRILVGTLIEVGTSKRTPDSMIEVIEQRERIAAGFTAPAQGLCLTEVEYE